MKFHGRWNQGPKKDLYSLGNNPQYSLSLKATVNTDVWIVLSRHITQKEDFANNKDFITLLVYKLVWIHHNVWPIQYESLLSHFWGK